MAKKRPDSADSDGVRSSQVRAQYDALKRQHPGRVLLFQLGDFYETFESDAVIVARVCDITLTSRELSRGDRVPLAGVPIHRAAPHIGKLVAAGYHVAICDQVSEPGKGLVERAVTRVVTPGTVAEPGLVSPHENNLIVSLAAGKHGVGLAAADVTTGELQTTVIEGGGPDADALLTAELQRLAPAECLVSETGTVGVQLPGHTTVLPSTRFEAASASDALRRLFRVGSLNGYGLPGDSPALSALGALVGYIGENNRRLLASLREPRPYIVGSHLALDPVTRRNLELTRTARHGQARGSLLHAVDRSRTPMGARRLRRLLGQPLVDRLTLEARLDALALLVEDDQRRGRLRATLAKLGDIERLIGRVRQATATPREVAVLAQALQLLPELPAELAEITETGELLAALAATIDGCPALAEVIERTLAEPGGPRIIQPGHSQELDELVDSMGEARRWLAQLERRERERTGIRSLKVGFNRVFGYYLEVTRSNLSAVPTEYQRRQSLVSAERFVTPELKEREALILTAEARVEELETELFQALLRKIAEQAAPIVASVEAVADLDVLSGLADVAADRGWCRPEFADDDRLTIRGGRHPVLEAMLPGGEIVPNDCAVGGSGDGPTAGQSDAAGRLLIVTGPNMGGKSTYLRMVALVVLLAQVGSFVPAFEARIGLADRLFTRVGSEDDLTAGASTFLVEMAETASILRQATPRSLVVLDEVGRGTSTHDGLCIAQGVLEHLHDEIGARTLFATHFHELTALSDTLKAVRNVTVAVDERDGQLAFLYRVTPGAADRSYGVQVARLAGLPASVTDRAALLLALREGDLVDATPLLLRPDDRGDLTPAVRQGERIHEALGGDLTLPAPLSGAERGAAGRQRESRVVDGEYVAASDGPLRRVAEDRPVSDSYSVSFEANSDVSMPLPPLRAGEGGGGGEVSPSDVSSESASSGDVASPIARQLLADLLGLDLGNLTPIQALNLLHQWQTAARASVPWHQWLASLTEDR